jgi:hypothetical protein
MRLSGISGLLGVLLRKASKKAFLPKNLVINLEIAGFLYKFYAIFLIFYYSTLKLRVWQEFMA